MAPSNPLSLGYTFLLPFGGLVSFRWDGAGFLCKTVILPTFCKVGGRLKFVNTGKAL